MECGGCTACCYAFPVVELKKERLTECEFANNGCDIYNVRPESCRECVCAWITQPHVDVELRPDKCGVIFERVGTDTMRGTIIGPIEDVVHGQIRAFKKQGFKVTKGK